jgi:hypothetical protein
MKGRGKSGLGSGDDNGGGGDDNIAPIAAPIAAPVVTAATVVQAQSFAPPIIATPAANFVELRTTITNVCRSVISLS